MEKMKCIIVILSIICLSLPAHAEPAKADRVFAESVLKKWGYKTRKIDQAQRIQSLKNYGDSEDALYAVFLISKSSHGSAQDAEKKMRDLNETRENSPAGFKNYTQIIRSGSDLYSIRALTNYTRLSHQPKFIKLVETYLKTKNHNKTEKPTVDRL